MPSSTFWHVSDEEICTLQGDGQGFTALMDDLLNAAAQQGGIPSREIVTNDQIAHRDGGVDTEVRSPVSEPARDETGWLHEKTIWQYKGRDARHARAELNTAIASGGTDRFSRTLAGTGCNSAHRVARKWLGISATWWLRSRHVSSIISSVTNEL
jgi:hypothetical protein